MDFDDDNTPLRAPPMAARVLDIGELPAPPPAPAPAQARALDTEPLAPPPPPTECSCCRYREPPFRRAWAKRITRGNSAAAVFEAWLCAVCAVKVYVEGARLFSGGPYDSTRIEFSQHGSG